MSVAEGQHHIDFTVGTDTYGFLLADGNTAYQRYPNDPFVPNVSTAKGEYSTMANKAIWEQTDWHEGMGAEWAEEGVAKYRGADAVDAHVEGQLILAPLATAIDPAGVGLGDVPIKVIGFHPAAPAFSDKSRWVFAAKTGTTVAEAGNPTKLEFALGLQNAGDWARYTLKELYSYGSGYVDQIRYLFHTDIKQGGVWTVTIYGLKSSVTFEQTYGKPEPAQSADWEVLATHECHPAAAPPPAPLTEWPPTPNAAPPGRRSVGKVWDKICVHILCTTGTQSTAGGVIRLHNITTIATGANNDSTSLSHLVLTKSGIWHGHGSPTTYANLINLGIDVPAFRDIVVYKGWVLVGTSGSALFVAKDPAQRGLYPEGYWFRESNGVQLDYLTPLSKYLYGSCAIVNGSTGPFLAHYDNFVEGTVASFTRALNCLAYPGKISEADNQITSLGSYKDLLLVGMYDGIHAVRFTIETGWDYTNNVETKTYIHDMWKVFDHSGNASPHVGNSIVTWRGRLYYSANGDAFEYAGSLAEMQGDPRNIGPSSVGVGLGETAQGNIAQLLPCTNYLLAAVDAGMAIGSRSGIYLYNGMGWHCIHHGAANALTPAEGFRICTLWRDPNTSRLYFNEGSHMHWMSLPDVTDNSYLWTGSTYAASGTLETGKFHAGYPALKKWLQKEVLTVKNITANTSVTVKYRRDGEVDAATGLPSWTTLGAPITSGSTALAGTASEGQVFELYYPAGALARYWEIQLELATTNGAETPVVTSRSTHYQVVGPRYYRHQFAVKLEESQTLLNGGLEDHTVAEQVAGIVAAYETESPFTLNVRDAEGPDDYNSYTVRLTSFRPVKYLPSATDAESGHIDETYQLVFDEVPD